MKVLLATNLEDLDEAIASSNGIELVSDPIYYREDVIELAEQTAPEVVVLTPTLPGNIDILDVIYQLRIMDIRIIFIDGELAPDDLTIKRIKELGVYDVLLGEIRIGQVIERIFNPNSGSQIEKKPDQATLFINTNSNTEFEDVDWDEGEEKGSTFSRLVKIGGDLKKNISVSVPRLPKKANNNGKSSLEKVVAVSSPVQSGKTFVAVNLAVTVVQEGYKVALVDIDYKKFSVHTWLNCPPGEDGLQQALNDNSDPMVYAYQPKYVPELYVFTSDPGEKTPLINDKGLLLFLQALQQYFDLVIVDTFGDFNAPTIKTLINVAGMLVIVNDPDFSHLLRIQREIDNLPDDFDFDKCVIVANQIIESDKLPADDAEKATGMKVSCTIPCKPRSVFESIKVGIPAVLFDQEIKQAFEELVVNELAQADVSVQS